MRSTAQITRSLSRGGSKLASFQLGNIRSFRIERIDHAAIGVRDLMTSKKWYAEVLRMDHIFTDDPEFNGDIAMIGNGEAQVALLKLPDYVEPLKGGREQKGHVAFKVSVKHFWQFHETLPRLLPMHRGHPDQSVEIEEADYGRQLSLFFVDPDGNEIEVTTWVDPQDPAVRRFQ